MTGRSLHACVTVDLLLQHAHFRGQMLNEGLSIKIIMLKLLGTTVNTLSFQRDQVYRIRFIRKPCFNKKTKQNSSNLMSP
jgi:hypothetical protein